MYNSSISYGVALFLVNNSRQWCLVLHPRVSAGWSSNVHTSVGSKQTQNGAWFLCMFSENMHSGELIPLPYRIKNTRLLGEIKSRGFRKTTSPSPAPSKLMRQPEVANSLSETSWPEVMSSFCWSREQFFSLSSSIHNHSNFENIPPTNYSSNNFDLFKLIIKFSSQ